MTAIVEKHKVIGLWCTKQYRGYCHFHRPTHLKDRRLDVLGCLQVYSAKLLLEVCGAAGAVWGFAEVVRWRTPRNTAEIWRPIALATFCFYLLRFLNHSKHYLEHERDYPPIKLQHRRLHKLPFVQIFSTKLLLEVCGASGAIWGSSEAFTWRDETNVEKWRLVAIVVGSLFFMRWICIILSYCLCTVVTWFETKASITTTIVRWVEITFVKFVLEVLGAAGAVWGFSEIVKLRTPATVHVWRPIAVAVGLVFAGRWLWQIRASVREERQLPPPTEPVGPKNTTAEERLDLELGDLTLTESVESVD
mmetsp:Transcript_37411/g.58038  ORF Transcript_37411/g.58038 Transcript_37411/m.58038 type:complete len:306 (-) Transcript_37411:336-1253(-)